MKFWIWAVGIIVIIVIIWVIRNLIKTKDEPTLTRMGGASSGGVKNFLLRCCGRGRY